MISWTHSLQPAEIDNLHKVSKHLKHTWHARISAPEQITPLRKVITPSYHISQNEQTLSGIRHIYIARLLRKTCLFGPFRRPFSSHGTISFHMQSYRQRSIWFKQAACLHSAFVWPSPANNIPSCRSRLCDQSVWLLLMQRRSILAACLKLPSYHQMEIAFRTSHACDWAIRCDKHDFCMTAVMFQFIHLSCLGLGTHQNRWQKSRLDHKGSPGLPTLMQGRHVSGCGWKGASKTCPKTASWLVMLRFGLIVCYVTFCHSAKNETQVI